MGTCGFKVFYPLLLSAQEKSGFSLRGSVVDSIGNPVGYATVNMLTPGDSSYITGAVADDKGNYVINNVARGKYLLHVKHLLLCHVFIQMGRTLSV